MAEGAAKRVDGVERLLSTQHNWGLSVAWNYVIPLKQYQIYSIYSYQSNNI